MVSVYSSIVAVSAAATLVARVNGHGYMLVPESQFTGSANSAWIVQIDPQWESSDWDGNEQGSVDTYKKLAAEKGVTEIRSLLDDTSIYGADCGFTNPNGEPQPVPTDGKAIFSRGIVHVGPCEIWLDDKMVLHEDDCYSKYGGEDQDIKSVFPVDYSQCEGGGCKEMRFYWLAFQGVDGKTVWQVYKDCIPLQGASGTSTFTSTTSTDEAENESDSTTSPSIDDTSSTETTTAPPSGESDVTETSGTVQPSSGSTSNNWNDWGNWSGNWGNWGGRQLRA